MRPFASHPRLFTGPFYGQSLSGWTHVRQDESPMDSPLVRRCSSLQVGAHELTAVCNKGTAAHRLVELSEGWSLS